MEHEQAIKEIQITRDQAKEKIDLYESLVKLRKNKEFKLLIEKQYLEKEAIRLVHLKAHPSQEDLQSQQAVDKAINAIGEFGQFLNAILQEGIQMKKALEECDRELQLIHEESEE